MRHKTSVIDMTGQRFNRLTAISLDHVKKNRGAFWKFKCDCGSIVVLKGYSVREGLKKGRVGTKSCGCLNDEKRNLNRVDDYSYITKRAYSSHCTGAERRGYKNDISFDQYKIICSEPCFFCGGMSKKVRNRKSRKNSHREIKINSLDRLNNEPFYSLDNVVSSCITCQRMKSDFTYKEFISHSEKIADKNRSRNV
jgi:hypothetical protein